MICCLVRSPLKTRMFLNLCPLCLSRQLCFGACHMMESSRKLCVHLEQAGPGKQPHDFCSALCLVCVCSVGERLVGGVHLPAGSRATNGQQQLLRYGEWVLCPAAARVLDSPASRLGKLGVDSSPLAPASVVHDFMLCEDPIWGPCVRSPCAYGSPARYLTVRTSLYCKAYSRQIALA